jgi:hypothetical protein
MINQHDTIMIVQRLAPADVHCYHATADGKILSREECCSVLRTEIQQRKALGTPLSETEKAQILQLDKLKRYFTEEAETTKSKTTINIAGSTLASVSTKAVRQEPSILATNDRKVMMVQHEDGSIVINVFIGASAVNSVDVTASTGPALAGDPMGNMGFGTRERGDWITADTGRRAEPLPLTTDSPGVMRFAGKHVRQMVEKLLYKRPSADTGVAKEESLPTTSTTAESGMAEVPLSRETPGEVVRPINETEKSQGDDRGIVQTKGKVGFEEGGSTVISIYMSRDYQVLDPIKKFLDVGVREMGAKTPESLEIRCRFGDPLATPLTFQTITLMHEIEQLHPPPELPTIGMRGAKAPTLGGETPTTLPGTPLQKIQRFITLLNQHPEVNTPLAQKWREILKDAPTKHDEKALINSVTGDNRYILEKLIAALRT